MKKFSLKEFLDDFYPRDAKILSYFGIVNVFSLVVVSKFVLPYVDSVFLKQVVCGALNPFTLNVSLLTTAAIIGFSQKAEKILRRVLIAIFFVTAISVILGAENLDFIPIENLPSLPQSFFAKFLFLLSGTILGVAEAYLLAHLVKK